MSTRRALCLAAAQLDGATGPLPARLERAEAAVAEAAGADLVLLPEAFLPGYAHRPGRAGDAQAAARWAQQAAARHGRHVAVGAVGAEGSVLLLAAPEGRAWRYHKRFPTWAERAAWQAGTQAVVAHTTLGRVGLVICADVVQPPTWRDLAGRVDLVLVAAAWTDYRGRAEALGLPGRALLGPWIAGSAGHRDAMLAAAAAALRVPVVYANACGPWQQAERFSGGSRVLDAQGREVARVDGAGEGLAMGWVAPGESEGGAASDPQRGAGRPPAHPWRWRAFAAIYRAATRLR